MNQLSVESPARGLYFPSGKPILSAPSPDQLSRFLSNQRVEYFSTLPNTPVIIEKQEISPVGDTVLSQFEIYTKTPLAKKLKNQLAVHFGVNYDGRIGVRGTACSLSGSLQIGSREVRSIEQILQDGSDTGKTETLAWPIRAQDKEEMYKFAFEFLVSYSAELRELLRFAGEPEDSVFPLALVYDPQFLDPTRHFGMKVVLPEDGQKRSQAIFRAFVLDNPHTENFS